MSSKSTESARLVTDHSTKRAKGRNCGQTLSKHPQFETKYIAAPLDNPGLSNAQVCLRRSPRNKSSQKCHIVTSNNNSEIISVCSLVQNTEVSRVFPQINVKNSFKVKLDNSSEQIPSSVNLQSTESVLPEKCHSPEPNRRKSFPPISLRTSPRRKYPVNYTYGNSKKTFRSPSPEKLSQETYASKYNLQARNNEHNYYNSAAIPDSKTCLRRSPRFAVENSNISQSIGKECSGHIASGNANKTSTHNSSTNFKKEKSSLETNTTTCDLKSTPSSERMRRKSASERELKKITDCWSPKRAVSDTARVLRNGRSLESSLSPQRKNLKMKREPLWKNSNDGKKLNSQRRRAQPSREAVSVRREILFDKSVSVAKRKYENAHPYEINNEHECDADEDSQPVPRRKKLRSEVKNDELWEGLQIQRFKRLTPKKEKIETQHVTWDQDLAQSPENISNAFKPFDIAKFPDRPVPDNASYDFSQVSVKLEIEDCDDENPYDPFGSQTRSVEKMSEYITNEESQAVTEFSSNVTGCTTSVVETGNTCSTLDDYIQNLSKTDSDNPSRPESNIPFESNPMPCIDYFASNHNSDIRIGDIVQKICQSISSKPESASSVLEVAKSTPNKDVHSMFNDDLQVEDILEDKEPGRTTPDCNMSSDVEYTTDTQTLPTGQDLEDTFMYYDFPSPSELESSHPRIELHVYNEDEIKNENTESSNNDDECDQTDSEENHDQESVTGESTVPNHDNPSDLLESPVRSVIDEEIRSEEEVPPTKTIHTLNLPAEYKEYGSELVSDKIDDICCNEKDTTVFTSNFEPTDEKTAGTQDKICEQLLLNDSAVSVSDLKSPAKPKRQSTENITPKRSARLQAKKGNTPSKWDEEYVYTPLRRAEESPKTGLKQSRSTDSTLADQPPKLQTKDHNDNSDKKYIETTDNKKTSYADQHSDKRSSDDVMKISSPPTKSDSTCTSEKKSVNKSIEKIVDSPVKLLGNEDVSSRSADEHPPLKIRVKREADGSTKIIASPSTKSSMMKLCIDTPDVILTPCDRKKNKEIRMKSLLKPSTDLLKKSSSKDNSKRKRSRPPESTSPYPDDVIINPENLVPDQSSRKKKEGTNKQKIKTPVRRHNRTMDSEIPNDKPTKKKMDDSKELLRNPTVGKHASILWLSENRRHFLLKHSESSPSEIDAILSNAWKNLEDKERLRYYQRASGAMRDENKHSGVKVKHSRDNFKIKSDCKVSKKMLRFLSLSPMEQHEELRRWLRFFVYEVSPAEYTKLMTEFKETVKEMKEHQQSRFRATDLEMEALYRKLLFQKILDLQDKIVDIYHQKLEKQNEIVKEGFDVLTKRLIEGEEITFSKTTKSDDLEHVLLDLKVLENDKKIAVSGTPLKSKSYENVLEQLQECEKETPATAPSTSDQPNSTTVNLPEANSQFARDLLKEMSGKALPDLNAASLEWILDGCQEDVSAQALDGENLTTEMFEELSKFFSQEALINHDMNIWGPTLSTRRNQSTSSSVLTDCLLADQFKILARNPSVFGAGVKMLIDPSQLKPFLKEKSISDFPHPAMIVRPNIQNPTGTVLRYAPSPCDKNINGHAKRRTLVSKYDKYKSQPSLIGQPPVTIHYANRSRCQPHIPNPRIPQISRMQTQRFPQTKWQPPIMQAQRSVPRETENRFTSIIHRRIQNVEGGTVLRYTATSMGRRMPPS